MERKETVVRISAHETVVAALTMEAMVQICDKLNGPAYEPLVFARVCDIALQYHYTTDIKPIEFLHMLQMLEVAKHVHRSRVLEPRVGGVGPHVAPTMAGKLDALLSRPLLREVLHNGV